MLTRNYMPLKVKFVAQTDKALISLSSTSARCLLLVRASNYHFLSSRLAGSSAREDMVMFTWLETCEQALC